MSGTKGIQDSSSSYDNTAQDTNSAADTTAAEKSTTTEAVPAEATSKSKSKIVSWTESFRFPEVVFKPAKPVVVKAADAAPASETPAPEPSTEPSQPAEPSQERSQPAESSQPAEPTSAPVADTVDAAPSASTSSADQQDSSSSDITISTESQASKDTRQRVAYNKLDSYSSNSEFKTCDKFVRQQYPYEVKDAEVGGVSTADVPDGVYYKIGYTASGDSKYEAVVVYASGS